MNIIQDITTAVKLTGTIRNARESGCTVRLMIDAPKPIAKSNRKPNLWSWTMESTLFTGDLGSAIHAVFKEFDEPTQHALTFAPSGKQWTDRIQFWENALRDSLAPSQYAAAMTRLAAHRTKLETA